MLTKTVVYIVVAMTGSVVAFKLISAMMESVRRYFDM